MKTNDAVKAAFKSWCARNGYKPARMVTAAGEARITQQRGLLSVEVGAAKDAKYVAYLLSIGATVAAESIGYEYPLLSANESKALAFFA